MNFCVYVNRSSKALPDFFQVGIAVQRIEAFREPLHVTVEFRVGDGRINLRSPYVLMSQQLADRFDRHSLRKRDRRGEGVPGRMERDVPGNARQRHDAFEADVAPAVARQAEYPRIPLHRFVFLQMVYGIAKMRTLTADPVLRRVVLIHSCLPSCWICCGVSVQRSM